MKLLKKNKYNILNLIIILIVIIAALAAVYILKRPFPEIEIKAETVEVEGLKKNYNIFFLSDSHICLTDERDDSAVIEKEQLRSAILFTTERIESWRTFDALIKKAKGTKQDLMILGGDIIDSAMYASIEYVKKTMDSQPYPYLYYSGNHDFEYGTEYYTSTAFSEYLPRLTELNRTRSYQVKELEDLIIFVADDYGNNISAEALEGFKKEIKKGKPMVVCLHVPLEPITGDNSLVECCKDVMGASTDGKSRGTIGPNGCTPNNITSEFMKLLMDDDSPVALVLAGHIHFYHKDKLNDKIVQIISGGAYQGNALQISLVGKE
ncbi:MAG: metallophosphoesterase [Lachnospiraceae bacterium]|nr:metallophosphoesterase [Lachnospiraceae bacterium]